MDGVVVLLLLQSFTIKISDRKNLRGFVSKFCTNNFIKNCHNFIYFCVHACYKNALNVRIKYNLRLLEREGKKKNVFVRIRLCRKKAKCKFSFIISKMPEPEKQMLPSFSRFSISASIHVNLDRSATAKQWNYKSGNKSSQKDKQEDRIYSNDPHIFTADWD